MRSGITGIAAMLMLCAMGRPSLAEADPTVLLVGAAMSGPFAALESKAATVTADRLGDELTEGHADLIYIGDMPDVESDALAEMLAGLPGDRPMLLVVNDCGWQKGAVDPDELRSALPDSSSVTIAVSNRGTDCDAEALAETFAAAASESGAARKDVLRDGGYRLEENKPAAGPAGELVITALPTDAMSMEGDGRVILASADPSPVVLSGEAEAADRTVTFAPENLGQPTRPGAPEPSIIVGDLAVLVAADARGPLGMPYQAREEIRGRDPIMFNRLLGRGAFDPEAEQVAAAIQTELARMNCYTGGIDGVWGAGSASALRRYFDEAEGEQASSEADIGLYRTIIGRESVQCPDIQPVARATPSRSSGGNNTRSQPSRSATPAQPATPQPAATAQPAQQQAAPGTRSINLDSGAFGSGIFK